MEDKDFIGKVFNQFGGESLLVLNKTKKVGYYHCQFQKYPFEGDYSKQHILKGTVINPRIEEEEFVKVIHHCKDGDLKIIKKTDKKQGTNVLWECKFLTKGYECIVYARKSSILLKNVTNPLLIEEKKKNQIQEKQKKEKQKIDSDIEFQNKIWLQHCGDSLRIIRKVPKEEKNYKGDILYECEFIDYPCICFCKKYHIINGGVSNNNFPWHTKEGLENYIIQKFSNKKPTILDILNSIKKEKSYFNDLSYTTIQFAILKFDLSHLIDKAFEGSYQEKEVVNWIKELNVNIIENCWNVLKNKEIDIYLPDFNLGIEYNGNFWHSNSKDFGISSISHQDKSILAEKNGIFLFSIFEYEWFNKKEKIKSLIKSKCGIFDKIIYARQCKIKELDYKIYAAFCNENHLQEECGARVKLGLFYKEELIQIMSFGSPRFTDKYEWEIIRECSKLGYCIIGGKEKLWKYFIKNWNPNDCISYCDFSKFNGNSYLKLGFKKERLNKPGFVWWKEGTQDVFLRTPTKHSEYKEKYLKIYDCGQLVFTWKK